MFPLTILLTLNIKIYHALQEIHKPIMCPSGKNGSPQQFGQEKGSFIRKFRTPKLGKLEG